MTNRAPILLQPPLTHRFPKQIRRHDNSMHAGRFWTQGNKVPERQSGNLQGNHHCTQITAAGPRKSISAACIDAGSNPVERGNFVHTELGPQQQILTHHHGLLLRQSKLPLQVH